MVRRRLAPSAPAPRSRMRLSILLLTVHLSACTAYVPFVHDLRTKNDLKREHLACLQYYLSEDVVIALDVTYETAQVSQGELKQESERVTHEVVFTRHAPGVAILNTITKDGIGVRFDPDQPSPLVFRRDRRKKDRYVLQVGARRRPKGAFIRYAKERYRVIQGRNAYLKIEENATERESSRDDTFDGERLDPTTVPTTANLGKAVPPPVRFKRIDDQCVQARAKTLRTPK